jgi:hypothetical protein
MAKGVSYNVEVIRFMDGSDQRYLTRGKPLRCWLIKLDQLTEAELGQLEQFFESAQGNFGSFEFPDPFSGANIPNCRVANPYLLTEYAATGSGSVALMVEESSV